MSLQLDKLYVVSDLHLGGTPGKRAFREYEALAWLVRHVAEQGGEVGLLLNGDVFDFLADLDNAAEFNPQADRIVKKLEADDELAPVFAALHELLKKPTHHMIVQIGNHDIELAVPHVWNAFRTAISSGERVPAGLVLEASGAGFRCQVAGKKVLAVHGNASDPWNVVDHRALARFSAGHPEPPPANAGTTMVVRVMNEVKQRYPFIDLLKPESEPLMAVLDAIDAKKSRAGLLAALRTVVGKRGGARELLSVESESAQLEVGPIRDILDFLTRNTESAAGRRGALAAMQASRALLVQAEKDLQRGLSARDLVREPDHHLSGFGDFLNVKLARLRGQIARASEVPDRHALRLALRAWLAKDRSFEPGFQSPIDRRIREAADPAVDVLIAGHTHLPRQLGEEPVYLNTGTWMRTLKLHGSHYLDSDREFETFFEACTGTDERPSTLKDLDALQLDPRSRPVAVVDATSAQLQSVLQTGAANFRLGPLQTSPASVGRHEVIE